MLSSSSVAVGVFSVSRAAKLAGPDGPPVLNAAMLIDAGAENGLNSLTTLREGDEVGDVLAGDDGGPVVWAAGRAGISGVYADVREALRYAKYFGVKRDPETYHKRTVRFRTTPQLGSTYLLEVWASVAQCHGVRPNFSVMP
jgi:hypothetical protein